MSKRMSIIISIIMILIIIISLRMMVIRMEETKKELEETKQELAEYKADELKIYPCPFCGSENVHVVDRYGKGTDCHVRCEDCYSSGPSKNLNTDSWDVSKAEAIELWNASYKRGSKDDSD